MLRHLQLDGVTLISGHHTLSQSIHKRQNYYFLNIFPVLSPIQNFSVNFTSSVSYAFKELDPRRDPTSSNQLSSLIAYRLYGAI